LPKFFYFHHSIADPDCPKPLKDLPFIIESIIAHSPPTEFYFPIVGYYFTILARVVTGASFLHQLMRIFPQVSTRHTQSVSSL
jgi:hypothetical protein